MADHECREHAEYNHNCETCILAKQWARGVRDERGVNHADNGAGWCVGHIQKNALYPDGDGRSITLVRHCPVLNTEEQVARNRLEDAQQYLAGAQRVVADARAALEQAQRVEARAARDLRVLEMEASRG